MFILYNVPLICKIFFCKLKILSYVLVVFLLKDKKPLIGKLRPHCNIVFATLENCREINISCFIIMIVNGFRNDLYADNLAQTLSPSVFLRPREIGLHHFLFLSWSKWQVAHATFSHKIQWLVEGDGLWNKWIWLFFRATKLEATVLPSIVLCVCDVSAQKHVCDVLCKPVRMTWNVCHDSEIIWKTERQKCWIHRLYILPWKDLTDFSLSTWLPQEKL